jgi:hypothetical protein
MHEHEKGDTVPRKTLLIALFLFACVAALPLCHASSPAAAPAFQAAASQVTPGHPGEDPGFGTWLAAQQPVADPFIGTAAKCRTCADCPSSQPFCCILSADGCASCFSRPVFCQPL